MKGALPIPYIIAIIFGVLVLAALGYWLYMESGKSIGSGGVIECQARQRTFCQQWKVLSAFSPNVKPPIDFSGGCSEPSTTTCMLQFNCRCIGPCDSSEDTFPVCGPRPEEKMCCKKT